ncbi:MAG: ATP-binding cassette domain-containing protein, partial [Magnetospirillum sp.]|nr:ATP-binding cassette domain-containing protein [Magnetospirillum sp.]
MTFSFIAGCIRQLAAGHGRFALLVLALLLEAAYYLGSPLLYKFIFDEGITQGQKDVLIWAVAALAGLLAAQSLATFGQERLSGVLGMTVTNRLRGRLHDKLQQFPPPLVAARSQGDMVHLFGADVAALEQALVRAVPPLMLHSLIIGASLVLLLGINWILFLITMAVLPVAVLVPKLFSDRASQWEGHHQQAKAGASGFIQESLATLPVIRLFHLARRREHDFAAHLRRLDQTGGRAYLFGGLVARTAILGTGITQLVVVGAGAVLAVNGQMTAGLLIAFIGLLMGIAEAVGMLTTAIPLLITAQQAHARIQAFLDETVPDQQAPDAQAVERLRGEITFDAVRFGYDDGNTILNGLSFSIRPGQRVALVGPSGCGKSTALSLLMRFALPQAGQVLLDGIPVSRIREDCLRANVGVVLQNALLFDASIRDNILAGRPDATENEMIKAAQAAGIHDSILAKPMGYDTPVSPASGALSGGERQRIAVARALIRRCPILLLDEATSALDPASEQVVNDSVAALAPACTVVSVTHRLASVVDYDLILVLKDGQLAQSGRHADLLAQGGLYADLWTRQQGMAISAPAEGQSQLITPDRLALIPFLSECSRQTLEELSDLFVLSHFAEGQYVFHHGDPGEHFYVIARGCVQVL